MNVVSIVLAVALVVFFLALGVAKILALPFARALAAKVGYSVGMYRVIGALEVAGAAGLLVGLAEPLLGTLAAAGLLLLLAGALITHLRRRHGPGEYGPAVISGVVTAAYLVTHLAVTG